jgi:hypothetical protein
MQSKRLEDWQNALWKILTNPAFEVLAAMVLVLVAAGVVIWSEAFQNGAASVPLLHK